MKCKYLIFINLLFVFSLINTTVNANELAETSKSHDLSSNIFEDRRTIPNGGDFTLNSSKGIRSLNEFKDKVVILTFGYLSCPDICPSQLRKVADALSKMSLEDRKYVQVLFITLDPARDKLDHLDQFAQYFDKEIISLTGSLDQIRNVADLYGVNFEKEITEGGKGYVINHSVASYILSPDNVIRYILSYETTAQDIANVIHNLFKQFYPINAQE